MAEATTDRVSESSKRLASLDTYRGIAMFLMVAEAMKLKDVARQFEDASANVVRIWQELSFHQSHVSWVGCSLHDMIQPSFSFMVGVSLPFSIAKRREKGQSMGWVTLHAFWRAFLLVFLGIFLRSLNDDQLNFRFDDTLTQIGLGYGFLFLLGRMSKRAQWIAMLVVLVGYWAAFAIYPASSSDYDYEAVGVPSDWPHLMEGFEAHWNKNANLAHDFDVWFMNKFPREEPFRYSGGGYQTLNFIPTLATMIMGLIAGGILRTGSGIGSTESRPEALPAAKSGKSAMAKIGLLVGIGVAFLAAGLGLEYGHICPLVKRIWTPSWALYSGGWCFVVLAVLYLLIDVLPLKWLGFPFVVIGMNSIAIYVMSWTLEGPVAHAAHQLLNTVNQVVGTGWMDRLDKRYFPIFEGGVIILVFWLILYWLYRQKAFLRI